MFTCVSIIYVTEKLKWYRCGLAYAA